MGLLEIIILFSVVGISAYFCLSTLLWTVLIGFVLVALTFLHHLNFLFLMIVWVVFLLAVAFAHLKKLRRLYFTIPLIKKMQPHMPAISVTEKEAIEAGNVWWEKELFSGRPAWKKLLAMPLSQLTAEEERFLTYQVETLCAMLDDWQIVSQDKDMPQAVWDYLKQERFFGMIIPKEYGGLGFSALAHSTVIIKIATRSISAAVNTMVPNSLGPAELLLHYGTDAQKNYYLPRLARGEEIPCFALTGPEAGSDAGSIKDTGIVCEEVYEGKATLGIRLSWNKRYITLAPVATVLGLAFRLYDPDHLIGTTTDIGITLCLIPANHPGVEIGLRHLPLHLAFMNGPTEGHDVFIPLDWMIGGLPMAGQGWRMLMECLSVGRSISLPALSTAAGKLAYRMTGAYARIRKQFNTPLAYFEGVEEYLANIAGYTYTLEACRIVTASAVDSHIKPAIVSAIAKYNMTEIGRHIMSQAMDIHAGQMIQVGPRNFLAHSYLSLPVSITVEGANILTRNLIIFGQGAIRCHPYILQEVELFSASDTTEKVNRLDAVLASHMGYTISNIVRSVWLGLTGGYLQWITRKGAATYYYQQLTRMSAAFALLSDMTMLILGGKLKRQERVSARLADMLSQLYLASTILKYFHTQIHSAEEIDYMHWTLQTCLYHLQKSCRELLQNFPVPWVGKLLKIMIFPWGDSYVKPKDELGHRLVKPMLEPSELRDRLTQFIYIDPKNTDPMRRLEIALTQITEVEPLIKKFQNLLRNGKLSHLMNTEENLQIATRANLLTETEAHVLREFDKMYQEIIRVNEFSFDLKSIVT